MSKLDRLKEQLAAAQAEVDLYRNKMGRLAVALFSADNVSDEECIAAAGRIRRERLEAEQARDAAVRERDKWEKQCMATFDACAERIKERDAAIARAKKAEAAFMGQEEELEKLRVISTRRGELLRDVEAWFYARFQLLGDSPAAKLLERITKEIT